MTYRVAKNEKAAAEGPRRSRPEPDRQRAEKAKENNDAIRRGDGGGWAARQLECLGGAFSRRCAAEEESTESEEEEKAYRLSQRIPRNDAEMFKSTTKEEGKREEQTK